MYLSLVSVSPAVDDCHLSPCVKKQSIVLLNGTDSKTSYRYILNVFGALQCQLQVKNNIPPVTLLVFLLSVMSFSRVSSYSVYYIFVSGLGLISGESLAKNLK